MSRNAFTLHTRFLYQHQVYAVIEILLDGYVLLQNQSFGGPPIPKSLDELVLAWARHELIFEVRGRNAARDVDVPIATRYCYGDFQRLEGNYEEAWRRYQLILPLLELPRSERTKSYLNAYAAKKRAELYETVYEKSALHSGMVKRRRPPQGQALSRASLERWLKDFTETYDIRSLVPNMERQGRGDERLESEVEDIIEEVFAQCHAHPAKRTVEMVHAMVVNKVSESNKYQQRHKKLNSPSVSTIHRRITAHPELNILRRKPSEREALDEQSSLPVDPVTRIMQRVEIDFTKLDLYVVDDVDRILIGRPTICIAFDRRSGAVIGFYVGFEGTTYRAAMNCLLHAILPKEDPRTLFGTKNTWPRRMYGIPELVVVDNECSLTGTDMYDAAAQLGFVLQQNPVKKPWWKAGIERFMRTHQEGFVHTLPGSSLSNIVEKGDADVFKDACISLSAFVRLLHIYLLDKYMVKGRKGIRGIPAQVWEADVNAGFWPCFNYDVEDTKIALFQRFDRTIGKDGILFENLEYRSAALSPIRKVTCKKPKGERDVPIKVNPGDLSAVYVLDVTSSKHGPKRWIRVPAYDPTGYTKGLSLWKHRMVMKFLHQNRPNIFDLADAERRMRDIVTKEFHLTRKQRARVSAMRFLGIGTEPIGSPTEAALDAPPPPPTIVPAPSRVPLLPPPPPKGAQQNAAGNIEVDHPPRSDPALPSKEGETSSAQEFQADGDFDLPLP